MSLRSFKISGCFFCGAFFPTEDGTPNRTPGLSPMRCVTFANLGIQKGCPVSSLRMLWHGPIKYTHASKTIQNINVNNLEQYFPLG